MQREIGIMSEPQQQQKSIFHSKSISSRANFKKLTLVDSNNVSTKKVTSSIKTSSTTVTSSGGLPPIPAPISSTNGSNTNNSSSKPLFQKSLNRLNKPKLNLFSSSWSKKDTQINLPDSSKGSSFVSTDNTDINKSNDLSCALNNNNSTTSSPLSTITNISTNELTIDSNNKEPNTDNIIDDFEKLNIFSNNHPKNKSDPSSGPDINSEIQLEDIVQLGKIGSGNSGTVLKVLHVPEQKIIAKKIIPLNNILNNNDNNSNKEISLQIKRQIVRELTIMQKIGKHDNIVEFHSAFYNTITDNHTKLVTPLSTLTIELHTEITTTNTSTYNNTNTANTNTTGTITTTPTTPTTTTTTPTTDTANNGNTTNNSEYQDVRKRKPTSANQDENKRISNEIIILMEYMNLGSLDRILNTYKAHCKRCCVSICPETSWFNNELIISKISFGVLNGLYFLYQNFKIIHRDIKPSNILLNSKGYVKICDFGVSKKMVNSIADTFVGTSTYMSPERIQGGIYTTKGDVWSLGLTIIELLSGKFPLSSKKFNIPSLRNNTNSSTKRTRITSKDYSGDIIIEEDEDDDDEQSRANNTNNNNNYGQHDVDGEDDDDMDDTPDGILDLLQRIVNEPSPTLPDYKKMYSLELRDFVNKCCIKDEGERASLKELLQHPLIVKYNVDSSHDSYRKNNHEFKHWCKNIKKVIQDEKLLKRKDQIKSLNLIIS